MFNKYIFMRPGAFRCRTAECYSLGHSLRLSHWPGIELKINDDMAKIQYKTSLT